MELHPQDPAGETQLIPFAPQCPQLRHALWRLPARGGRPWKTLEDPWLRPSEAWSGCFQNFFSVRYFSHFALLLRAFTRTCRIFSSLQLDGFHLLKPKNPKHVPCGPGLAISASCVAFALRHQKSLSLMLFFF